MLHLITLFIIPYLSFVVFGYGLNPFQKPHCPAKRSRWRYGRAMALASLAGSISIVAMMKTVEDISPQSFVVGIIITLLMAIAFSTSKIIHFFWRWSFLFIVSLNNWGTASQYLVGYTSTPSALGHWVSSSQIWWSHRLCRQQDQQKYFSSTSIITADCIWVAISTIAIRHC